MLPLVLKTACFRLRNEQQQLQITYSSLTLPLICMLAVIPNNMLNVLSIIDSRLTEMNQQVLLDALIQGRLLSWRYFLEQASSLGLKIP